MRLPASVLSAPSRFLGDARMIIVMMLVSAMPEAGAGAGIVRANQRHTPFHSGGPALTPALLDPHDATVINIS